MSWLFETWVSALEVTIAVVGFIVVSAAMVVVWVFAVWCLWAAARAAYKVMEGSK